MKTFLDGSMLSMNRLILLILPAFLGCASPQFVITSDPGQADVFLRGTGANAKKPIGKTPITMSNADFKAAVGADAPSGGYFPLIIEKDGFVSETFMVPAARFGTMMTRLDAKLQPVTAEIAGNAKKQEQTAKDILDRLFLAQKYALTQQFERAHMELDGLIKDHPTFARALSMRASIYFAQRNFPESLKWYEEALKADPQMDEAVRMTAKIRAVQSGQLRLPATAQDPATAAPQAPVKGKKK
jgi:tetratricopeptide (TPR) repeat protein